ncbi:ABC transporter ATP-binding protein [Labrys wisconsinensis]|uniref:Spermidine/putrescine transport system ATP-binding protein n=1 Tax=Labrys wisconsinensis TaxID=425677 RepID=A0ABU0JC10_9HYPH|nr:ABC transporter ATP-binding protein [Labrys wisconsinensis]MDQ0471816.1 putative spermidine/putrescine transport system ATP-binding protein [Labrys wisconsinensis]
MTAAARTARSSPDAAGSRLELDRVTKRYGGFAALDGVSLAIEPGEFFTLLGPSGSGKSSILSLIAGFDTPTDGAILVDGRLTNGVPAYERGFGVVFQNYALFPHLSVEENIAYPLRARRMPSAEIGARVREALRAVRLEGYEKRHPRQLSGGQQQRVAMARAIVFRPRVLLMDEPLGALDRKLRIDLQIELKQLHRTLGATIIFVSHDQEEALALSDRIAVLRGGRIEQVDTPAMLYDRPATPFVAGFIGDSNFFAGTLRRDGQTARVALAGGPAVAVEGAALPPDGTDVTLSVRPEQVALSTAPDASALPGRVVEVVYLGTATKVIVETPCGTAQALVPAQSEFRCVIGTAVSLSWPAAAARVHRR